MNPDTDLLVTVPKYLDDESSLIEFTAAVLPTRFGRSVVGAIDWRRASVEVLEALEWPYRADRWLIAVDLVAKRIMLWAEQDDGDESWFTAEEQERRQKIADGEKCDS